MNQNWIENAPPIRPEEEGLNPSHLQRLRYNPNYYYPNEEDLKIGLPLWNFYGFYITCMKRYEN